MREARNREMFDAVESSKQIYAAHAAHQSAITNNQYEINENAAMNEIQKLNNSQSNQLPEIPKLQKELSTISEKTEHSSSGMNCLTAFNKLTSNNTITAASSSTTPMNTNPSSRNF
jgi:hypothetical protein